MDQNSKEGSGDSTEAATPAVPVESTGAASTLDGNEEQERLQSLTYPSGLKFVLITIALCLAILLITLVSRPSVHWLQFRLTNQGWDNCCDSRSKNN